MVGVVLEDTTFRRVCKSSVRLLGRRYEVEAFKEARPDAFCSRCSRWGQVAPQCSAAPRCSICPEEHTMQDQKGVGPDEAVGAHIRLPGTPIARALMERGLMRVQPRRRRDKSRGGGDPPCVSTGRRGPGPRPLRHSSTRPRMPRGRGR